MEREGLIMVAVTDALRLAASPLVPDAIDYTTVLGSEPLLDPEQLDEGPPACVGLAAPDVLGAMVAGCANKVSHLRKCVALNTLVPSGLLRPSGNDAKFDPNVTLDPNYHADSDYRRPDVRRAYRSARVRWHRHSLRPRGGGLGRGRAGGTRGWRARTRWRGSWTTCTRSTR